GERGRAEAGGSCWEIPTLAGTDAAREIELAVDPERGPGGDVRAAAGIRRREPIRPSRSAGRELLQRTRPEERLRAVDIEVLRGRSFGPRPGRLHRSGLLPSGRLRSCLLRVGLLGHLNSEKDAVGLLFATP